jgi:hypothetical protein
MVSKRRISKRKSVRKNRKGSKRRSYKKMRGGEKCTLAELTRIEQEIVNGGLTFETAYNIYGAAKLVSCGIDSQEAVNEIYTRVRPTNVSVQPQFGKLALPPPSTGRYVPPPPMPSVQSVDAPPSFAHVESVPETEEISAPVDPVASSTGYYTRQTNDEFIRNMREEEARRNAEKAEEEASLSPEARERKMQAEAEARAHDQSKSDHVTKLASGFGKKAVGILNPGRGRGRGRGGGSRRRQRGGGRGHGR